LHGSTHKTDKIRIITSFNIDDYGKVLADIHGVGLTSEEFKDKFAKDVKPMYMWMSNEWIAKKLNKKILKTE
jgi:4-hydroxy-tetrahydrodipicolinate reductase